MRKETVIRYGNKLHWQVCIHCRPSKLTNIRHYIVGNMSCSVTLWMSTCGTFLQCSCAFVDSFLQCVTVPQAWLAFQRCESLIHASNVNETLQEHTYDEPSVWCGWRPNVGWFASVHATLTRVFEVFSTVTDPVGGVFRFVHVTECVLVLACRYMSMCVHLHSDRLHV